MNSADRRRQLWWEWPLPALLLATGIAVLGCAVAGDGIAFVGVFLQIVALLALARQLSGQFASLAFLFAGFFAAYGLSGPWQVVTGIGMHSIFGEDFDLPAILLLQACSGLGLGVGMIVAASLRGTPRVVPRGRSLAALTPSRLLFLGFVVAACGSLMEVMNFLRVGGMSAFVLGKAYYQTQVGELGLTMPGYMLLNVAAAMVGSALATGSVSVLGRVTNIGRGLLVFVLCAAPALIIALGLGRRGVILAIALILFLGVFGIRPLRVVAPRIVTVGVVLYLFLGVMFALRPLVGFGLATGDWRLLQEQALEAERLQRAFSPGSTEFGAPFGNLAVYLREGYDPPYLGETYLRGLTVVVPGSLYPGDKPRQINYEIRDRYFPRESSKGGVAGAGFSAILEAYLNFRHLGAVVVYAAVGFLLICAERIRGIPPSMFTLVYCLLGPLTQSWHRSQFGFVFASAAYQLLFLVAIVVTVEVLRVAARRLAFPGGQA